MNRFTAFVLTTLVLSLNLLACSDDAGGYQANSTDAKQEGDGGITLAPPSTGKPAPEHVSVNSYNGCITSSKVTVGIRTAKSKSYFTGKSFTDGTGPGSKVELWSEVNDYAPVDYTISSLSGTLVIQASESLEYLGIVKESAEQLWQQKNGSPPGADTYFTNAWQDHLLAIVDCSPLARSGAVCKLAFAVPSGTVASVGSGPGAKATECRPMHLVMRTH